MLTAPRQAGPQRQKLVLLGQLHPAQRLQCGDEAGRIPRDQHRAVQVELLTRHPPRHHDAPGLAALKASVSAVRRKTQRRKRDAEHRRVARCRACRGGVEVEVGCKVLAVVAGGVHAVGQAAGGIDPEELRRLPAADGVEVDHHKILGAVDTVVPHQRRPDQRRIGVDGFNTDIDRLRIEQHLHPGRVLGHTAGVGGFFDKIGKYRRAQPSRMRQRAVQGQPLVGQQAMRRDRGAVLGQGRVGGRGDGCLGVGGLDCGSRGQQPTEHRQAASPGHQCSGRFVIGHARSILPANPGAPGLVSTRPAET